MVKGRRVRSKVLLVDDGILQKIVDRAFLSMEIEIACV
jgi:hypothetical protein